MEERPIRVYQTIIFKQSLFDITKQQFLIKKISNVNYELNKLSYECDISFKQKVVVVIVYLVRKEVVKSRTCHSHD